MISCVPLLALTLLAIVVGLMLLEKRAPFNKLFHYLPIAFWCYFIPVLLATAGLLPAESPVYTFLTTYGLAACLLLLLLSVNLPAILRVGPTALGAMGIGSLGIAAGAVISYALFASRLPDETWKGIGALSASWTGGSANMLAVKEGLQVPDAIFAPMVIVDTVVTYSWMALMIALAPMQARWDTWVRADRRTLEEAASRVTAVSLSTPAASGWHALWLLPLALAGGALCLWAATLLPKTAFLSVNGWAFLMATAVGIGLSFTPAARLESLGATRWGYFCLYLLLAAIGSKARLQDILRAPLLMALAIVWVFIHAALLALYGWWRRVPLFFLVTASQANIGGTASAPIVAGLYQPRLASVGLLLAIAANVVGTYIGMAIAYFCSFSHR